jgi:hypothetical protein
MIAIDNIEYRIELSKNHPDIRVWNINIAAKVLCFWVTKH